MVEGATEFIPVSSTGHLILAGHAMAFVGQRADIFEIFIQLGAILAVVWQYRAFILRVLGEAESSRVAPIYPRAAHRVLSGGNHRPRHSPLDHRPSLHTSSCSSRADRWGRRHSRYRALASGAEDGNGPPDWLRHRADRRSLADPFRLPQVV